MKIKIFIITSICLLFISCKKEKSIVVTTDEYHAAIENVTQIMIHDIFSPPVASRIFVYPNIAAYEVIAQNSKTYTSLQNQLKGLDSIPKLDPKSGVNIQLAALIAHMDVSKQLVCIKNGVKKMKRNLKFLKNTDLKSLAELKSGWIKTITKKHVRCLSFLFMKINPDAGSLLLPLIWTQLNHIGPRLERLF